MLHQLFVHNAIADAQPCEACPLAKRPQHHQVLVVRHHIGNRRVAELIVRLIYHHDPPCVQQFAHMLTRSQVARRIIRGRQEDNLSPVVKRILRSRNIDVKHLIPLHHRGLAAGNARQEAVHREGGVKVQNLVPRLHEQPEHQVNKLITSRTRDNLFRSRACIVAQRAPDLTLQRVRVDVNRRVSHCIGNLRRSPVWILVPVEFHYLALGNACAPRNQLRRVHRFISLYISQMRSQQSLNFPSH